MRRPTCASTRRSRTSGPRTWRGRRHVLELAGEIDRDHGLERLVHVSTAYVAGERKGTIEEGPPTDRFGFASPYERSKYEGEMLVRAAMDKLPIAIARPAMVVGDSRSGAITTFNTVYAPLRLYMTGRLRVFPMRPDLRANIVPVDHVADAIVRMASDPAAAGTTYHLTAPADPSRRPRSWSTPSRIWSLAHLGVRLPRPIFAPIPPSVLRRLRPTRAGVDPVLALLPYFQERRTFLAEQHRPIDRAVPVHVAWVPPEPARVRGSVRLPPSHRSDGARTDRAPPDERPHADHVPRRDARAASHEGRRGPPTGHPRRG